jgi:hypothetical protein
MPQIRPNARRKIEASVAGTNQFLAGAERHPLCGPRRRCQDGQKLPVRAAVQPDYLREIFFYGAIWCDLVRFGAIGGTEFKVQSSRFKVQSCRRGSGATS